MKYKSLIILLYFGYTLKTKYKYLADFTTFFPLTSQVIEKLQNHLIFNFSFLVKFRQLKKGYESLATRVVECSQ